MTVVIVIGVYLAMLLLLGLVSNYFFRGTSSDYFVASRSIGPFMLLMSVFGTTMTAFAMVGSTAKAYTTGIGVYGLMASWSGLIHSAVFFLVGIKLWAIGKRYGYVTQCQFFRDRYQSPLLGYALFVTLMLLLVPYLLLGLKGAGTMVSGVTVGVFPQWFADYKGAVPPWLTALVVSVVVLAYVFFGGVRSAVWSNTFQTGVFMVAGIVAFVMIAKALGGADAATAAVVQHAPAKLVRQGSIGHGEFLSYIFVPLSVGMFPHLFQHWLTARSAKSFRLTVIAHPICIMLIWVPCILIGIWAAGAVIKVPHPNAVLGKMVGDLVHNEVLTGLLAAGVLAAILGGLDSQFVCMGSMFTHDFVLRVFPPNRFTDKQLLWMGRCFVVAVVAATYLMSLVNTQHIFDLGVWCFSGFASLFPICVAAVYWRRATAAGALASLLTTVVVWVALFARDMQLKGDKPGAPGGDEALIWGVMPVTIIFTASTVALVIVSLLTRPPSEDVVSKFLPRESASRS
jgi:SSS family solute:Na+ symporter